MPPEGKKTDGEGEKEMETGKMPHQLIIGSHTWQRSAGVRKWSEGGGLNHSESVEYVALAVLRVVWS